jgi:hypothetical protein
MCLFLLPACAAAQPGATGNLPPNQWTELSRDMSGARRGSAIRYAPGAGAFFLWGYMNDDPELPQENRLMKIPEYDMVYFSPAAGRWQNHFPFEKEAEWSKQLPMAYHPGIYMGITTGSRRTIMRGDSEGSEGVPRPALNIVFDQVAYRPPDNSLLYFTGGLTAVYNLGRRSWQDLQPPHSPPPVLGGMIAYDPSSDEMILYGGGHVAEAGAGKALNGHSGTWVYSFREKDWKRLALAVEPPPRMNARMVTDTRNRLVVLFGGDGQKAYLADTWIFDLRSHTWRASKAPGGPPPRAGHFAVYDPRTGLVIIGGGYNRQDLSDMWAYDAAKDRWQRLAGAVPAGFYISGDIAPEQRLILLTTNTRKPGDRRNCNTLYPVRTTFGYRIDAKTMASPDQKLQTHRPMPKRDPEEMRGAAPHKGREAAQASRIRNLPVNHWLHLADPGRVAPLRTWGSATFDTDRGQILYWGGGHCGYGGSDVDAYVVDAHTWRGEIEPEHPGRSWDKGVSLAGVTFGGRPWTEHGRKIYAYDPVSKRMIMVRPVGLTDAYEPDWLKSEASGCPRCVTWSYDPETRHWERMASAPPGLTTLVTTPLGVMGVNVAWGARLDRAGYLRPWETSAEDKAVFLFNASKNQWVRLGEPQTSPQNMYEMTSLAYDARREQVVLHGGGPKRNELWIFNLKTKRWRNMEPRVVAPEGAAPPECTRESVYIPGEDVVLIYGPSRVERTKPALWEYSAAENVWRLVDIPPMAEVEPRHRTSQNRAMVYDPKRDLVLLVLGSSGDAGPSVVFAMRYRRAQAASASRE